ncbi:MAG: hypothetical protein ABJE66_15255 [Deltaproteobacteria bacterium]
MRSAALLVIAIAACSGDEPPPAQNNCTGAVYDKCNDEHDCTAMNCRPFGAIQVCTQVCSDTAPCPNDEMGNAVSCNSGLCQPAAANNCKLAATP